MSDLDAREELRLLVRAFRTHLERQQRAGVYTVPAGVGMPGGDGVALASAEAPPASTAQEDVDDGRPMTFQDMLATLEEHTSPEATHRAAPASAPPAAAIEPAASAHPDFAPQAPAAPAARRRLTLTDVRAELGDCQRCKLAGTRTNIVFGVGDPGAALMFIGEAPGEQEDRRGEPFVGPAGQLLDRMIEAMGWTRDTVYIANVLKCRPPRNRDPQEDEVAACRPFLLQQIDAIAPRIIVTLGRPAAQLILQARAPMSALRGRFQEHRGIKVMPTFHPAFLLRQPQRKRDTWSDLKQVIAALERLGVRAPRPAKT